MGSRADSRCHDSRRRVGWPSLTRVLRDRLSGQRGFSLVELLVVILAGTIVSVAVLLVLRGTSTVFNSQEMRILNQDDARLAINQMSRFIRMATSSADNESSASNAIATALGQDIAFYCDVDGDGIAEKVRYYVEGSVLWSQTEDPVWVETPTPGVVIENRVRNEALAMFTYYRYNGAGALESFVPTSDAQRAQVVNVGITIKVGERPDLAPKDVVLSTDVQIRQRYEGGLK
jgi:prepilin-type N-terminal cleavage/methylation domain-containing protein